MCGATGGITWRTLRRGCSDNLLRGGDDLRLDGCFGIFVNVNRLAQRLVWFQDIRVEIREWLDVFPGEEPIVSGCDAADGEAAVSTGDRRLVEIVPVTQP